MAIQFNLPLASILMLLVSNHLMVYGNSSLPSTSTLSSIIITNNSSHHFNGTINNVPISYLNNSSIINENQTNVQYVID